MKKDFASTDVSRWTILKRKIRKVLYFLIAMIVIIGCAFIYWKYFYTYSNGYRAGLLQMFSHKGNIIKTYEGEMILCSISSNSNVAIASEKFYFSVTNQKLAQQLDTIQGRMVIVHYEQKNGVLSWQSETSLII